MLTDQSTITLTASDNLLLTPTKKIIMVIDDDEESRAILTRGLSKEFEVITFESASDAVLAAERQPPYAVMVDIFMPNIDGYEVLSMLRNNPATSNLPIICMSGTDSEEIRSRATSHGASSFIRKPFELKKLAHDVSSLIQALNKTIVSADSTRKFTITYNDSERLRRIKSLVDSELKNDQHIVILSLVQGTDFFSGHSSIYLEDSKIVYLEMKPQLIVKLPFLMDVSPVIIDILSFLDPTIRNYHLIFDEVRNVLNLNDAERTLSKAHSLSQTLRATFPKISYFSSQPTQNVNSLLLQKIARVFTEGKAD